MQNRNIDYNHINLNSHDNNINSVPRQASLKHYIQFNGKSTSRPMIDHKSYHVDPHPLQFNHGIKSTQKNYQYDQSKETCNQKINFIPKSTLNKFGQNYSQNEISYKHYKPADPCQFSRKQTSFFLEHEQNKFTSVKDKIMKIGIGTNPGIIKNEFETLNIPKQPHSQQLIQQSQPINYYRNPPHLNSIYIPSNKLSSKQQQQNNNVKATSPQFFHQSQTISLLRKDIICLKQKLSTQQKQYQSFKQEVQLKNIERQSLLKEMTSKLEVTIDFNKHLKNKFNDLTAQFNDLTVQFNSNEDALRQQKKLRQKLMNEKGIWLKRQQQLSNKIQGLENYILKEESKLKGLTQKLTSLESQLLIYKERCESQQSNIQQMKEKIEIQNNKNEHYETDLRQGKQILKASALIIEQLTFQLKKMQNQKKQLRVEMEKRILDQQKCQKLQSQVKQLNDKIKIMKNCLEKETKKNQQKFIIQLQQKELISNLDPNQIQESKNLQRTFQTFQIETQTCQLYNLSEKQKEIVSQNIMLQSNVEECKKIIKNLELKLKTMSPQKLNRGKQMFDEITSLKLCNNELSKQNKRINLILQGLNIKIIQMDRVYHHLNQQINILHIQKMNEKFRALQTQIQNQTISDEM